MSPSSSTDMLDKTSDISAYFKEKIPNGIEFYEQRIGLLPPSYENIPSNSRTIKIVKNYLPGIGEWIDRGIKLFRLSPEKYHDFSLLSDGVNPHLHGMFIDVIETGLFPWVENYNTQVKIDNDKAVKDPTISRRAPITSARIKFVYCNPDLSRIEAHFDVY